jgi:hypothetical protein
VVHDTPYQAWGLAAPRSPPWLPPPSTAGRRRRQRLRPRSPNPPSFHTRARFLPGEWGDRGGWARPRFVVARDCEKGRTPHASRVLKKARRGRVFRPSAVSQIVGQRRRIALRGQSCVNSQSVGDPRNAITQLCPADRVPSDSQKQGRKALEVALSNPVENLWKTGSPRRGRDTHSLPCWVWFSSRSSRRRLRSLRLDEGAGSLHDGFVSCGERVVERSSPPLLSSPGLRPLD